MIGGGGGGGGREEATDSGDGVYGDKGNSESYYLLHGRNSDDVHLIGTQTPDQPECGAWEPQLRRTGGTGGRDSGGGGGKVI